MSQPAAVNETLIHRANQVAAHFAAYPAEHAAREVERHLRRYWEPRIRRSLLAQPTEALHPLVRQALAGLRADAAAQ
ncbi:MAG: formate dehydrogenase subunit delta [Comamonadaceae bacterium]|nr:formate dehydrogenase subunit delta [Burkholderiales bacterium]MEB2347788.1 formate dehydrogenase subunit delta [Comamonadaceae bacterium]